MVVIVSGEAILSAENRGKPSGGRVPPRTPLGSSQRSPRPSSWSGEGLLPTPPRTPPCCLPWALRSCPNEKSYARPRRDLHYLRQGGYALPRVCLFVCLLAISHKTTDQIFLNVLLQKYLSTRNSPLHLGKKSPGSASGSGNFLKECLSL